MRHIYFRGNEQHITCKDSRPAQLVMCPSQCLKFCYPRHAAEIGFWDPNIQGLCFILDVQVCSMQIPHSSRKSPYTSSGVKNTPCVQLCALVNKWTHVLVTCDMARSMCFWFSLRMPSLSVWSDFEKGTQPAFYKRYCFSLILEHYSTMNAVSEFHQNTGTCYV